MPTQANTLRPHDDAPDTEAAFVRLADTPSGPERDALRQELIRAWLPMSERLASRFKNRGETFEDLCQVAALGLVKAVDRYDPQRGSAFVSFAVPTITGEVKRHFRDHMWTLHVPRRVQDQRNRVRTAQRELLQTISGRTPTEAEIARRAGLTVAETKSGMEALGCYSTLSLDAQPSGGDHGVALAEVIGAPDHALDVVIDREAVRPRLRKLPERERKILYMRFFRDMTQSSIAKDLGISQMHVSRLISNLCDRLRREIIQDAV
ncbi:SigB/SigF/SigG family RNA polymerase sigma factor [Streptomyces sp. NPDC056500]|uniref:SigB/SigF/SigG family RNA polymerase sigma factor n=1 Tax=Streptomyces sp. NPDC056500 TaxID=3345840 RepID=UPI00369741A7